jgi:hypothetical protein
LGRIDFIGKNDAGQDVTYGTIFTEIGDASDGTEDARMKFLHVRGGSEHTTMEVKFGEVHINGRLNVTTGGDIRFEGTTSNDFETVLSLADPTADRTITLPDATGTVALTSDIPSSGISSGNVATFTSGVADNDFLRIDGTSVEGRSASEVLSDIGATTAAAAADEATALAIALG